MSKTFLMILLASFAFMGCTKNSATKAAESVVQSAHDPSQCPNLSNGYYNADTGGSHFIEVYNNTDQGFIELNMNGYEKIPVNGRHTPQSNGAAYTGGCVGKNIRIVGRDPGGNSTAITIRSAPDGGLNVDQDTPKGPSTHYSAAGPLHSTVDQIKKWFTPDQSGSGV